MTSPAVTRKQTAAPRAALTLVETRLPADPFLLHHFENFYTEIVEHKSAVFGHTPVTQIAIQPADVRDRLLELLLQQEEQVFRTGTLLGVEMYRQAQRVMACMADEIFSAAPWPANNSWRSLEVELFESGRQYGLALDGPCMKKLDLLLQQDDSAYRELATVYFYALALAMDNREVRQKYWRPLLDVIGARNGPTTDKGRVFAQSYVHTLAENKLTTLPAARKWWLALALIVGSWLSVSWLVWNQLSPRIDEMLEQIHRLTQ